jgi:hypothetical protein
VASDAAGGDDPWAHAHDPYGLQTGPHAHGHARHVHPPSLALPGMWLFRSDRLPGPATPPAADGRARPLQRTSAPLPGRATAAAATMALVARLGASDRGTPMREEPPVPVPVPAAVPAALRAGPGSRQGSRERSSAGSSTLRAGAGSRQGSRERGSGDSAAGRAGGLLPRFGSGAGERLSGSGRTASPRTASGRAAGGGAGGGGGSRVGSSRLGSGRHTAERAGSGREDTGFAPPLDAVGEEDGDARGARVAAAAAGPRSGPRSGGAPQPFAGALEAALAALGFSHGEAGEVSSSRGEDGAPLPHRHSDPEAPGGSGGGSGGGGALKSGTAALDHAAASVGAGASALLSRLSRKMLGRGAVGGGSGGGAGGQGALGARLSDNGLTARGSPFRRRGTLGGTGSGGTPRASESGGGMRAVGPRPGWPAGMARQDSWRLLLPNWEALRAARARQAHVERGRLAEERLKVRQGLRRVATSSRTWGPASSGA